MFDTKDNNKNSVWESYYSEIDFKEKYIWAKDFSNEINCIKPVLSNTVYERRHSKLFTNCHKIFERTKYFFLNQRVGGNKVLREEVMEDIEENEEVQIFNQISYLTFDLNVLKDY